DAAGRAAPPVLAPARALPRARRLAGEVPEPVGSAPRPIRSRARGTTAGPQGHAKGATEMSEQTTAVATAAARPKVVIERTYKAHVDEVWDLWTTKVGFESWWGPQGFRVEVHALEARVGGALRYEMIAHAPEQIEAMKKMGQPVSHETRGRFVEVK